MGILVILLLFFVALILPVVGNGDHFGSAIDIKDCAPGFGFQGLVDPYSIKDEVSFTDYLIHRCNIVAVRKRFPLS